MANVIETEKLTKSLRLAPRHHRGRPRGRGGRGLRLPRAERRRQDDDDPDPARPHPADRRARPASSASSRSADPVAIHRRVGYLPGEFALYDRLTGAQHLEYFANLRGGVDQAYQASLVERFDLDPSRRFKEYSKGNKQKVALVIALQHRPELLLLDEPTSGLDPLVQQTFFIDPPRGGGRRARPSSSPRHILSEVEKTADRVGDHPRGPPGQGRHGRRPARPRPPPGRAALRRARSRRPPSRPCRASATWWSTTTSCACASPGRSRRSCRRRPATSCSTSSRGSRASRRPSSPSTAARPWRWADMAVPGRQPRAGGGLPPDPAAPQALRLRLHLRQDDPRLPPRLHHRGRPARRDGARHGRRRVEHLPDAGRQARGGRALRERPRVDDEPVRQRRR